MTVNFNWTDKDSTKWFVILPTGHEGPYSLNKLGQLVSQKKLSQDVKVWAEGLSDPMILRVAFERNLEAELEGLPPLPIEEDEVEAEAEETLPPPPLPVEKAIKIEVKPLIAPKPQIEEAPEIETYGQVKPKKRKDTKRPVRSWKIIAFFGAVFVLMIFLAFGNIIPSLQKVDFNRPQKMSPNLYERVLRENIYAGWDKKIFFKEYLPDDHSIIWLVTPSYQACDVEVKFTSVADKLLAAENETVSFTTKGKLVDHVTELSSFDFSSGTKIVPGLYEMDVKATNCKWDGFFVNLVNGFNAPDETYKAVTKVVLFSKGAREYNTILDKLLKRKYDKELKVQNANELFWQDLQQKLETLQAITLQVEQLFLDLLEKDSRQFLVNLKPTVKEYTQKYGAFLTSFVVENEAYFKNLNPDIKGISVKRNYEHMIKQSSTKLGLETMKLIEEFQGIKTSPKRAELNQYSERIKKLYGQLKKEISEKIIQISEDRSV